MKKEYTKFANGLRHLRQQKGWSQVDLEKRSGILPQAISAIEKGRRRASLDAQWALANAFDLTPEAVIEVGEKVDATPSKSDNLPNRLRKVIDSLGCNQTEFAHKIGVAPRTVTLWLTRKSWPSARNALNIERVSGYFHRWLMDDDFEGPSSASAQWVYENKDIRLTHQQVAALYERINEIIDVSNLTKYKLIDIAKINTPISDDHYFIGAPPKIRDIKKIADSTGYNPDWILKGDFPKKHQRRPAPYPEGKEEIGLPPIDSGLEDPTAASRSVSDPGELRPAEASSSQTRRISEAVAMLLEVMNSRDEILVSAIERNLKAFQQGVVKDLEIERQQKEIQALKNDIAEFKLRVDELEKRMKEHTHHFSEADGKGVMSPGS